MDETNICVKNLSLKYESSPFKNCPQVLRPETAPNRPDYTTVLLL